MIDAIVSTNINPITTSQNLQVHTSEIQSWLNKWKMKINENQSAHIIYTLKKVTLSIL